MHNLLTYVSQQLGAHAPLLQGRVGAGADAKLAVGVSRHRKENAAMNNRESLAS